MKQDDTAEVLRELFRSQSSVQAAYLYGSVARGDAGPKSDVDVALLLAHGEPPENSGRFAQLSKRASGTKVGSFTRRSLQSRAVNLGRERFPSLLRRLLERVDRLAALAEPVLERLGGSRPVPGLFEHFIAFRWEASSGAGRLVPIAEPRTFDLDELMGVERSVERLLQNTEQFVRGLPANHVLLFGERGTGKSSAVRGLLPRFSAQGLRIVEVHKVRVSDQREHRDRRIVNTWIGIVNTRIGHGEDLDRDREHVDRGS